MALFHGIICKKPDGGWVNLFLVLGKVSYTLCMGKDLERPTEMHALSQTVFVGVSVKETPKPIGLPKRTVPWNDLWKNQKEFAKSFSV